MGSISDRSNPKYFLPLGLLLSSALMAAFGLVEALYASLAAIIARHGAERLGAGHGLAALRQDHGALVQHQGARARSSRPGTPRTTSAARWSRTSRWSASMLFHDWGAKFYFNALVAAVIAIGVFFLLEDTPQSRGLPPVEQYKNDYPPGYTRRTRRRCLSGRSSCKYVLTNRFLWAIAIANAFCYFVRYGVVNWIPTYLETAKGFSFKSRASPGRCTSTRRFRARSPAAGSRTAGSGRRAPMTMLFMALTLRRGRRLLAQPGGPLWIDYAALFAIGFLIYGPIMMIGLHSLDLVPKKAAGTAAGFTGFFGYVFGSAIAGTGVGWIADHWGWGGVFVTMVACCVLDDRLRVADTATPHVTHRPTYSRRQRREVRRRRREEAALGVPPEDVLGRARPFLAHQVVDLEARQASAKRLAHRGARRHAVQQPRGARAVGAGQAPAIGVAKERDAGG